MQKESNGDNDEESEDKFLEKEISKLRLAKKTLFEKARPINEQLEQIALRERECVNRQQQLRAKRHDRHQEKQTLRRLIEQEAEIKRLKCANIACSDMNKKLKQSLDLAARHSRAQALKIDELNAKLSAEQQQRLQKTKAASDTAASSIVRDLETQLSETRELLSNTQQELSKTRQHLSDVQERLTVAEQLTAATQQRQLQEFDNSEQLQLELALKHQKLARSGTACLLSNNGT